MSGESQHWPHAPPHFLAAPGTYMVTAGTYGKQHYFRSRKRLRFLTELLLSRTSAAGWSLEAWAAFSNHYHWIGRTPGTKGAEGLPELIADLHRDTATFVNELDDAPGRRVWFNYRDTSLTFQRSYLARLHYVSQNAVKHGLVLQAVDYPWCSAAWLEKSSTPAFRKTLATFKLDRIKVDDDF